MKKLYPCLKLVRGSWRPALAAALICAGGSVRAQAQVPSRSADTSRLKTLGEVIVTGQYQPQSLKNSVYRVRVINNEMIRLSGATGLSQVLNTQLGLRLSNDNTLGVTDIQLMGMSGRSVKILLDGVPVLDRGDTRESIGQIDINSIDRVEIVEGPMSVSYGSDALAGVINIITKKGALQAPASKGSALRITARTQEETAGKEYYPFSYHGVHLQNIGVNWQERGWGLAAGGTHNESDGYGGDAWGRGKSWKPKEQWSGNLRVGYQGTGFSFYYRLDGLHETILSKSKMGLTYKAMDQRYITDRTLHQVQGEWKISRDLQWNGLIAYTDYTRKTRTTEHDFMTAKDALTTGAGEQDTAQFNSLSFRTTLQYRWSEQVSLQPGVEINRDAASGARIAGKPVITDYAFFISSEIKPTKSINIRPGLRVDKNSVYDAPPLIPSLNTHFILTPTLDLRLAYGYGFRAPALRELYFDFHDANHDIVGNPDLKAEHSNSFTGGLSWTPENGSGFHWVSSLNGFYNDFHNLISYAIDAANPSQYKAVNIDRFKTTGATLENKISRGALSAALGFSYIGSYNRLSDNKAYQLPAFVWTPEVNANLNWLIRKLDTRVGVFYKFTGQRPGYELVQNSSTGLEEVQLYKISAFHWADISLTKPLFSGVTVAGGVKNIFDVTDLNNTSGNTGGAHSSGNTLPMSYGRSYFLSLSFEWNKK